MSELGRISAAITAALSGRADVRLALLFGSVSKGRDMPESDVDVAVLAPGVDLFELEASISLVTGREAHVTSLEDPPIPLLEEIVRDGIVVHEGQRGRAATWRSRALASLETDLPWYRRMSEAWLKRVAEKGLLDGQS